MELELQLASGIQMVVMNSFGLSEVAGGALWAWMPHNVAFTAAPVQQQF